MSDITKEELKDILWYLVIPKSIKPGNTIVSKLQDLIDSYDEPEECEQDSEFEVILSELDNQRDDMSNEELAAHIENALLVKMKIKQG
jgi:hypothetical protein